MFLVREYQNVPQQIIQNVFDGKIEKYRKCQNACDHSFPGELFTFKMLVLSVKVSVMIIVTFIEQSILFNALKHYEINSPKNHLKIQHSKVSMLTLINTLDNRKTLSVHIYGTGVTSFEWSNCIEGRGVSRCRSVQFRNENDFTPSAHMKR